MKLGENLVMVTSASDYTLVIDLPQLQLRKMWTKRGMQLPIDREQLFYAYYSPAVEKMFKDGVLRTDDKEFLQSVGLLDEAEDKQNSVELTTNLMNRIISLMPLGEAVETIKTLSKTQIDELTNYAIRNYKKMKMDRVDILSKLSGLDVMKSIENFKAAEEG